MIFSRSLEIVISIFTAIVKRRFFPTRIYWDIFAFVQMYFLAKLGCVFVLTGEQMKLGRNEIDLLYMTYIISVLKILFGHGIFAFFAFCMLPSVFPAPCKELSTICSHASLQLNMLLKHVEPHWCPGGNHLPVKQKRTLLPARLLAAPGLLPQPLPSPPWFYSGNLCSFKTPENLYSSLFSVQET